MPLLLRGFIYESKTAFMDITIVESKVGNLMYSVFIFNIKLKNDIQYPFHVKRISSTTH